MKKILPMSTPVLNCYPDYGHVFSIVGAHTQEHLPWVYNYFVQLYAPSTFDYGNRLDYFMPEILNRFPWIRCERIKRDVALNVADALELVKSYINHDYYYYAIFNVSQIAAYQNTLHYHNMLIYGYDDEKKEFYFADNYKHGKYSLGIASYTEVKNAIEIFESERNTIEINGIRYARDGERTTFEFDKKEYINLLCDYIQQKRSGKHWEVPGTIGRKYTGMRYGVEAYSFMQEYMTFRDGKYKYIDIRGFYVIQEHKLLLEKALNYVLGNEWKHKYSLASQQLEKGIEMATIALNLCLKYNITYEQKIIDKIRYYIAEQEKNDYQLFPYLIGILEVSLE